MSAPIRHSLLCPITIGRDAERAQLRAHLSRESGALLVSGEPGVGKSRLVRETIEIARESGLRVVESHCFEADRTLPLAPAIEIVRAEIAQHGAAEVTRRAGMTAPDLARLAPELMPFVTGQSSNPVSMELAKHRLFDAVARLVISSGEGQKTLVVVEDIHWCDDSSYDLMLYLAHRSRAAPFLFLLTYRDDEVHPALGHLLASLDRERLSSEIALAPLDAPQVAAMVQAILGSERLVVADLLHTLYKLTDGNPFFLEEVLSSLHAAGQLDPAPRFDLRHTIEPTLVPRSVHDAVRQRLERVSEPARAVLVLAAVAGRQFDFDLLCELTGVQEETLLALMRELVGARLVVEEPGDRFAFRHALTREAVIAGLLNRERRRLHRRIAAALEQLHADTPDGAIDDLSVHWFAAGCWREAIEAGHRAGIRAVAMHAPRAAIDHFTRATDARRALGLPPDADIHRERGRAFETLGDFGAANGDLEFALVAARERGDRRGEWQILLDLGLLWASRNYTRTGQLVTDAVAVARELNDPAALGRSLNRLGNWQLNAEQPRAAIALHREALSILSAEGDQLTIAETLDLLGMASILGADSDAASTAYGSAVEIWRSIDDRRGLAASLLGRVLAAHTFHTDTIPNVLSIEEVVPAGEEGLALSREIGWRAGESFALWSFHGMALGAVGRYGVALQATRQSVAIAEEIGHQQWLAGARCILGLIHGELGDFVVARSELSSALALAREIGSLYWRRSAAGWLASVLVREGRHQEASSLLEAELSAKTPLDTIAGRLLWTAAAELALATGDAGRTLDLIGRLLECLPEHERRPVTRLERLRGLGLLATGACAEAEAALQIARRRAAWSGARSLQWRIAANLGQLYHQMDSSGRAVEAFAEARMLTDALAKSVPDAALRHSFSILVAREFPEVPGNRSPRVEGADSSLTKRELEVAALLTQGLTNRQIGDQLFLSEWTIATHVRNILAKLDLASRAQIAAWAAQRNRPPRS